MATDALKTMKEQIMSCVQSQLNDIKSVDTHELGEAIDMIKDLSEAIYYCTITDSMEKAEEKEKTPINNVTYYTNPMPMYYNNTRMYTPDYYRDIERNNGYMYYSGSGQGSSGNSGGSNSGSSRGSSSYYTEIPLEIRSSKEGRSPLRRRMYMEGKEMQNDTNSQLHELQAYLQQLSRDITEMIKDSSTEEKTVLKQKMSTLIDKIK